jgi:hypothetical protein
MLENHFDAENLTLGARVFTTVDAQKNFPVFFYDRVTLDFIARAIQSFSGFEIESEGVLTAPDHLVPNIAFFQRRPLVRAPSLDGVENAGAAQNQHLFSIGQLGSEITFLFKVGLLADENSFHENSLVEEVTQNSTESVIPECLYRESRRKSGLDPR